MRTLLLASLLLCASPTFADETSGQILAFDRVAKIIVLDDKTTWQVEDATEISDGLMAGDTVKIIYVGGGDSGIASITSILKQP